MYKYILSIVALLLIATTALQAEETPWPVPQDKAEKTAPFMFDANAQKSGEALYLKNCKSCHGDVGQANMIPLDPLPKDLSIDAIKEQNDGSFFYKIANGRGAMPKFQAILSVNDIWNVIAYIRSFHKGYTQPVPSTIEAYAGGTITLALEWLADVRELKVKALGKENDEDIPAEGVELALFAERYFGQLKIGESKMTNKDGVATFILDGKLPGDSHGNLNLLAKVVDVDNYGEVSVKGAFIAGAATDKPGLTEKRAMWNVRSKAPWWLTLAYPGVVLAVLGTILYIALLLKKVNELGKEEE